MTKSLGSRFLAVGLFAIAFACVEASVVVYLRGYFGIEDLVRDVPPLDRYIAGVELSREAATLFMLLFVGWAVGRSWQSRLGYAFFAFGLWDVFYYVWLRVFLDWPRSLLDTDILFLIPLPWWGPVLSPVLIALVCIVGGAFAVVADARGRKIRPRAIEWVSTFVGMGIVLYTFMADAIAALPATAEELNDLRPTAFPWTIYLAGLVVMSWPVLKCTWPGPREPE